MTSRDESADAETDRTWHELPRSAGEPAAVAKTGLRPTTVLLTYIGSSENGFADAGRGFELTGVSRVAFGRIAGDGLLASPTPDLLELGIPVPWVSGAHAELELDARGAKLPTLRLKDLGSRNGTAIEGRRVEGTVELQPGQVFELGRTFWILREVLAGTSSTPHALEPTGTAHPALGRIYRNLDRLARTKMPLLVLGETGAGKDYLARAIHVRSGRPGQFVRINLLGVSMGELLMGTGSRPGLLQQANHGTVYVDEIASLERDAQTKLGSLLSYAEDEDGNGRGDLRVIASSTHDLRRLVERGEFRPDLYSRLAHYEAHLPPLRERREDLGLLLKALTQVRGTRALRIETAAFRKMLGHPWPFNIRELRQTITAVNALEDDGIVTLTALDEVMRREDGLPTDPEQLQQLRDSLLRHLKEAQGNVTAVARVIGMAPEQVTRVLRQFHIDADTFAAAPAGRSNSSGTLVDMVTDAVTRDVYDDD